MRKILLATTILTAMASAAHAAQAPIQVKLGGYVDFRAAMFHESKNNNARPGEKAHGDFATEYLLDIAAEGKASGVDYGAYISLWNGDEIDGLNGLKTSGGDGPNLQQAYIWVSGDFGKFLAGDEHGPSDMFVAAPTVGEGQINGNYTLFTDDRSLAQFRPIIIDDKENATKVTYISPKVGGKDHTLQLGVSFIPEASANGNEVHLTKGLTPYSDLYETALRYEGNFDGFSNVTTAFTTIGRADGHRVGYTDGRSFTLWGIGSQIMFNDITIGASYADGGHYGTYKGYNQTKPQQVWSLGVSYEKESWGVALNALQGRGYFNAAWNYNDSGDAGQKDWNYIESFTAVGLGGSYTWVPGLTTSADAVFFSQVREGNDSATAKMGDNRGHVFMLTQKMVF